ncbi:MAG: hypothetical protein ACREAB_07240 [Blastocatellia bacterium]
MAILGLTDQGGSFPEIGVLRKGAPKPENGNKPGADLTYFRLDTNDEAFARKFKEFYGEEPRVIHAFVPYNTTAQNFEAWREEWGASSLKHRCNGQTTVLWLTPHGTYSHEMKPCPGRCKPTGRLKIIIPELKRMAHVAIVTTSIHDILTINANLQALELARGSLRGIPLLIRRAPREISAPGTNGQRIRREKWLITIEAQPSWVELQLAAQERAALPINTPPLALSPAFGDDDDEIVEEIVENGARNDLVTSETLRAIEDLWLKFGIKQGMGVEPFADYLHRKKQLSHPSRMTQEDAQNMLEWLQQKALALAQDVVSRAEVPVTENAPASEGQADCGTGLDQWRCTRESGSRQLAMNVLNATKRLEDAGAAKEQWRAELNAMFTEYAPPVSRKTLSAEECGQWIELLNQWAGQREVK